MQIAYIEIFIQYHWRGDNIVGRNGRVIEDNGQYGVFIIRNCLDGALWNSLWKCFLFLVPFIKVLDINDF